MAEALRDQWPAVAPGVYHLELVEHGLILTLGFGDATQLLTGFDSAVDAFYLDGFSPAKNPELWSPEICRSLACLAVPGATLATWSVAGGLRRALSAANFVVEKRLGFATKGQMLVARYDPGSALRDMGCDAQTDATGG